MCGSEEHDASRAWPREFAKRGARWLCSVTVLPLYLVFRGLSLLSSGAQPFASYSQCLALIPGQLGIYLRAAGLHRWEHAIAADVSIGFLTLLSQPGIEIGESVYIGPQCNLGLCSIGHDSLIGSGVHVLSGNRQHGTSELDRPWREQPGELRRVRIGRNCWVGNQATVLAEIGNGCIVAAGAVVTRPVPDDSVVAGNPARVIRNTRELATDDRS